LIQQFRQRPAAALLSRTDMEIKGCKTIQVDLTVEHFNKR